MRIVLDLQGAQTESRIRGIGRSALALATAIARSADEHDVRIVLNGLFPETVEPIRAVFDGLIPQDHIHVWEAPGPVRDLEPNNAWRRQAAERLREAFLASLKPDVLHVSSLFEGFRDDAVTSIGTFTSIPPTSVTLYDLVPLIYRETHLIESTREAWYERKLDHLRRARLWLAVSDSSRREGIDHLGLPKEWVVNISSASDPRFRPVALAEEQAAAICTRYGLTRPFVLYTGSIEHGKNVEGLIRAYALLPKSVRRAYQLGIVSSVHPEERAALERLATSRGLSRGDLVLTGFVPDEDLVALYNLCTAFAFPSWHEGFGLPALEAMACGAAVIGANTSSLPEVIGREDALFDPRNDSSIAAKLNEVLTDEAFRAALKQHGPNQTKNFSWDRSAQLAIEAFERLHVHEQETQRFRIAVVPPSRPQLAYVSPLPPERTGIANYSAELLPELARHYEIDVVVDQAQVTDPWVQANCRVRNAEWFDAHADLYDRVVYHFGNSTYHEHMFGLLERHPGVVVLHDFFLSGFLAHMELSGLWPNAWTRALYQSHGYAAAKARFDADDIHEIVRQYPCNLNILQQATGVVVHSEFSRKLAVNWYNVDFATNIVVIPQLIKIPTNSIVRNAARMILGFEESDFLVCCFGMIGPTKLNHRLLESWLSSPLAENGTCHLVFAGDHDGPYGAELIDMVHRSRHGRRVRVTGHVPEELYQKYLAAADVAVQLRTDSRGETSRTVLECMGYELATIINSHGSMVEIPTDCIWQLPDNFQNEELAAALEHLWKHPEARKKLGAHARIYAYTHHTPRRIADQYMEAIEGFYEGTSCLREKLTHSLAALEGTPAKWLRVAEAMTTNLPALQPVRQLFVDVSSMALEDLRTGIQRVTRSILHELLNHPPKGYRVEPVYATPESSYRYARQFTMQLLNCPVDGLEDEPLEFHQGDCFLGLDWTPDSIPLHQELFARLRNLGGRAYFVVYDLLPVNHSEWFPRGTDEAFERWLMAVSQADGALCDSRTVASDLMHWLDEAQVKRHRPFTIGWFHNGGNLNASIPTLGLPQGLETLLKRLGSLPNVLMVGTVEPRKGHAQAVAAFEQLWAQGVGANLVIVGKQGWMVDDLCGRLRHHPQLGRRLFWLEGISDEALSRLYGVAAGVLMASQGEGYGLPLVEAAQHRLPVLARDIPVFREIAGNNASYFSGDTPEALAKAVNEWLMAIMAGTVPGSGDLPWQTWAESTQQIVDLLADPSHPHWLYRWMPEVK
ncbi:MAG: glycosyltransferase [Thermaerobacter sp.]|nr:glycosyltransferase [Thermaerobacter sp.]